MDINKAGSLKRGTMISMIMRAGSGGLDVVMGAVMARILSIEHLGLFFLFSQFVRLWSQASAFGMPTALLKVLGIASAREDWTAVRAILGHALRLLLFTTLAMAVLYALIWPLIGGMLFGPELTYFSAGLIFAINALRAVELIGSAFFRGVRLYSFGTMLMSVPRQLGVVLVGAGFLVLGRKTDIETVLVAYFAVALLLGVVIAGLIWHYLRSRPGGAGGSSSGSEVPSFGAFGGLCLPLMLQAVIAEVALRIDLWVLGFFGSETDIAIFGAAQRLTLVLLFILSSVNLVIPPTLAATYRDGNLPRLQWLCRATATASFFFALPFTLILIAFAPTVMATLYGPAFEAGALSLILLTIGRFGSAASGNPLQLLQMTGHHVLITRISIVFIVLSTALCVALVGPFGAEGVAAGSAIALILRNLVMIAYARQRVGVWTWPTFSPAALRRLWQAGRRRGRARPHEAPAE